MRGRIPVGRHGGASLDALDVATLVGLLAEIDEESRALLATYLDRRDPPGAITRRVMRQRGGERRQPAGQ